MPYLELFVWAIVGGLIVAVLSTIAVYYNKEEPNMKHLSRDFILGAATTGFLYPLIPESFDDMKSVISTAGSDLGEKVTSAITAASSATTDPGVQVGPANF
jgi:O-antigen/teichoic acid export membrane protein